MKQPDWLIPENLQQLVDDDEDGMWEDERWNPILLTVMKGTSFNGRDIPIAWQIDFEPFTSAFEESNKKLVGLGLEPDGYGWATLIRNVAEKYHPEIVDQLQFGDTEQSTCVVWVESESACHQLVQMVWSLIYGH